MLLLFAYKLEVLYPSMYLTHQFETLRLFGCIFSKYWNIVALGVSVQNDYGRNL